MSKVLEVPVSFFYEDMEPETAQNSPRNLNSTDLDSMVMSDKAVGESDPMQRAETLELVKAYYKISNRNAAKHIFDLIITMSKTIVKE